MPQSLSTAGTATRRMRPEINSSAIGKSTARLVAPCAQRALPYLPRQGRLGEPARTEDAAMAFEAKPDGTTSVEVVVGLAGVVAEDGCERPPFSFRQGRGAASPLVFAE